MLVRRRKKKKLRDPLFLGYGAQLSNAHPQKFNSFLNSHQKYKVNTTHITSNIPNSSKNQELNKMIDLLFLVTFRKGCIPCRSEPWTLTSQMWKEAEISVATGESDVTLSSELTVQG